VKETYLVKKIAMVVATLLVAGSALASTNPVFDSYESARQALLKESIAGIQNAAKQVGTAAKGAGQTAIAARATELQQAADVTKARAAFAALSDEVIKYRSTVSGDKPVVAYCSMAKKSWLQPKGAISNPYYGANMRACGEIKAE
jgi:HPt (histidine-containing phosphotransfer) domain-containing protein